MKPMRTQGQGLQGLTRQERIRASLLLACLIVAPEARPRRTKQPRNRPPSKLSAITTLFSGCFALFSLRGFVMLPANGIPAHAAIPQGPAFRPS
jgi:hypothetical protein